MGLFPCHPRHFFSNLLFSDSPSLTRLQLTDVSWTQEGSLLPWLLCTSCADCPRCYFPRICAWLTPSPPSSLWSNVTSSVRHSYLKLRHPLLQCWHSLSLLLYSSPSTYQVTRYHLVYLFVLLNVSIPRIDSSWHIEMMNIGGHNIIMSINY